MGGGGYRRPFYRRRKPFRRFVKKSYRKKRYGRKKYSRVGNAPIVAIRRYGVTPITEARAAKHYDVLRERAEKYRIRVTQAVAYAAQKGGGAGVKPDVSYAEMFSQASEAAQGMASMANTYSEMAHGQGPALKSMRFSSSNITTF